MKFNKLNLKFTQKKRPRRSKIFWKKDKGGACMSAKSLQLCPTLCDPMDCSPPGFSVHGMLQARTLLREEGDNLLSQT